MTRNLRALLVPGLLVLSTAVRAQPANPQEEGRRHFVAAQGHYTAGRYDEALVELEAARTADPQPPYLFSIAQVYRLKGDCKRAIPAYGAYLRTGPKPEATKATQMLIDECTAALEQQATQPASATEPPTTATPAPVASPPAEPLVIREVQRVHTREITLPWYRDTWGNVLVGSGLGASLIGVVALVAASSHDDDASTSQTYQQFDAELRSRDRWQTAAAGAFITGGALIVGGLLHYALRPKRITTEVLVDPGTGTAGLGLSWSTP